MEDRVKRRKRGEETLQPPGCQRSRPSPPIAGCHTWLAQTLRVISLHQRSYSWSAPSFLDSAKKASNLSGRKTKLVGRAYQCVLHEISLNLILGFLTNLVIFSGFFSFSCSSRNSSVSSPGSPPSIVAVSKLNRLSRIYSLVLCNIQCAF